MKTLSKVLTVAVLAVAITVGLVGPITAHAATAPNLGAADNYAVFGKAGVTNSGALTHIWGNVGADATNVTGLIASQVDGVIDSGAGVEAAILTAYGALNGQGADGGQTLSGTVTITPGVWTVGAGIMNGNVTLNGAGVYIFRSSSTIVADPGALVTLTNGATACNVFWQVPDSFTIGSGAHIEGTIITSTSFVSLGTNASLVGRALSRTAQVTLLSNLITNPCAAPAPVTQRNNTITVFKQVINDSGGTANYTAFPLFVNGNPVNSGQSIAYAPGIYTITETNLPGYVRTFTGNCDANGRIDHGGINTHNDICTVVNNDIGTPSVALIPPLIDLLKTSNPSFLPAGPGSVVYTYTLRNIGTVPVSNIAIIGDTCSPIVLVSGDTNNDSKLDMNETWVNTCTKTISETHTNTAVATGWANGISAVDVASATVVVGLPIVPPLIHVVKIPSPLTLPAGAGMVTYTYTVTNPGTVALSNVNITDDKCTGLPGRVVGQSRGS